MCTDPVYISAISLQLRKKSVYLYYQCVYLFSSFHHSYHNAPQLFTFSRSTSQAHFHKIRLQGNITRKALLKRADTYHLVFMEQLNLRLIYLINICSCKWAIAFDFQLNKYFFLPFRFRLILIVILYYHLVENPTIKKKKEKKVPFFIS